MWFKIKSYLHFLLTSTNQHGIHSPFVFELVTNCFYQKTNPAQLNLFKNIQNGLFTNDTLILVTDFGKGSKVFKSNQRKISDIAKIAGISTKKACLLIRLCSYFKFQNCLEIGTSLGLGTVTMNIGNPTSKIVTLEGCPNTAEISLHLFKTFNFHNIAVQIGKFNDTLPLVTENKHFDFIYFDGHHQKEATLAYFNECLKTTHHNSVFIFDDIYWSEEMKEAWETIKKHPKVTITIDTYFWGIVFFRQEQQKQHFKIRV